MAGCAGVVEPDKLNDIVRKMGERKGGDLCSSSQRKTNLFDGGTVVLTLEN